MATTKHYTAEDLFEMEDDGCRHELIRGQLITMPPTNDEHSGLALRLNGLLWNYLNDFPEIVGLAGSPGCVLARDPDTVLGPDLAIIHANRLPPDFPRRTFCDVAPDLVVEITSIPGQYGLISRKIREYLNAGVKLVWLVDTGERNVTIYAPNRQIAVVEADGTLDGGDVLPEFWLPLSGLFG